MQKFHPQVHILPDFCLTNCELEFVWEERVLPDSKIPDSWTTCKLRNESSCDYTFSFSPGRWSLELGLVILHLTAESEKGACPMGTQGDYLGIFIGKDHHS